MAAQGAAAQSIYFLLILSVQYPDSYRDRFRLFLFLLKHLQHPVCYHKTTYYIQRPQYNSEETQYQREIIITFRFAHNNDGADYDDTMNGICATHQRRM